MEHVRQHDYEPDVTFDGGDLDCGGGLLLLIRKHIDPLEPGGLLEILSTDSTVEVELPAWCRLTGNELVSWTRDCGQRSFLVCKGTFSGRNGSRANSPALTQQVSVEVSIPESLPRPAAAPEIAPLSVMGIGSWPRPGWMRRALHDYLESRLTDEEFAATADDAVRLCIAQLRHEPVLRVQHPARVCGADVGNDVAAPEHVQQVPGKVGRLLPVAGERVAEVEIEQ